MSHDSEYERIGGSLLDGRQRARIAAQRRRDEVASEREKFIATLRDIARAAECEHGSEFASLIGGWASTALAGLCVSCNQRPCSTPKVCCRKSLELMAAQKGRSLDDVIESARRTSGPQAPISSPSEPVSGCGEIAQDGDTEETT